MNLASLRLLLRADLAKSMASSPATGAPLTIDSRRVVRVVVLCAAVILLLGYLREIYVARHGLDTVLKNLRFFDLDSEGTLPAWFSSGVLVMNALQLAVIAVLSRRSGDGRWRQWALLASVFVFLAFDEAISVHEIAIVPLRSAFGLSGVFFFAWVIPAAGAVAVLGLYFLPFVLALPLRYRLRFFAAGFLFVGGALGMELSSGYFASIYGFDSLFYILSMLSEETLEVAGSVLFLATLALYLRDRFGAYVMKVG